MSNELKDWIKRYLIEDWIQKYKDRLSFLKSRETYTDWEEAGNQGAISELEDVISDLERIANSISEK